MKMYPSLWKVTRDNQPISDLTTFVRKGRVSFDPDRNIKWAFEADVDAGAGIKPYTDYIAPYLTVEHEDGTSQTSQFGIYMTVPPRQSISQTSSTVTIDSRDLTWILSSVTYPNGCSFVSGQNIVGTVRSIITAAGITRHSILDHGAVLPADTSWKAGSSYLTVINDLLGMVGYYTLYMTKDGQLASRPYVSDKNKAPSRTYDTTTPGTVSIVRTIERDTSPERIANQVTVIGPITMEVPIVATRTNDNPSSPTSTVSLGMTITKTYEGVQVADQESAEIQAQRYLDTASQQYHRLTLHTTPDVEIEPYDVYRLNIVDANGILVANGIWNQRGWTLGFTPSDGVMTHEMSNIDTPPDQMT